MRCSPSFVFSNSSLSVKLVGFLRTACINSPDFVSNRTSPSSPNLFPDLLTTVFPKICLESLRSSSAMSECEGGMYLKIAFWRFLFSQKIVKKYSPLIANVHETS